MREEGKEEDLEGLIPQGPSGNSIGFWFRTQRKLNFAKSEKSFCKIICTTRTQSSFLKFFPVFMRLLCFYVVVTPLFDPI